MSSVSSVVMFEKGDQQPLLLISNSNKAAGIVRKLADRGAAYDLHCITAPTTETHRTSRLLPLTLPLTLTQGQKLRTTSG